MHHHTSNPRMTEKDFVEGICDELAVNGFEKPVDLAGIVPADGLHGPVSNEHDLAMYILKRVAERINVGP